MIEFILPEYGFFSRRRTFATRCLYLNYKPVNFVSFSCFVYHLYNF